MVQPVAHIDEIAQVVAELLDAWNAHDLKRAAALYARDYTGTDVGYVGTQGRRQRLQSFAGYIRAFPDLQFTGDIIVDGQRVVLRWTMLGTHRGTFMHIPPTGRAVEVQGVSLLTVNDGKITHGEIIWDTAGLLRCLGLLPEL